MKTHGHLTNVDLVDIICASFLCSRLHFRLNVQTTGFRILQMSQFGVGLNVPLEVLLLCIHDSVAANLSAIICPAADVACHSGRALQGRRVVR